MKEKEETQLLTEEEKNLLFDEKQKTRGAWLVFAFAGLIAWVGYFFYQGNKTSWLMLFLCIFLWLTAFFCVKLALSYKKSQTAFDEDIKFGKKATVSGIVEKKGEKRTFLHHYFYLVIEEKEYKVPQKAFKKFAHSETVVMQVAPNSRFVFHVGSKKKATTLRERMQAGRSLKTVEHSAYRD